MGFVGKCDDVARSMERAIEIASTRAIVDGIWDNLPLSEKIHFMKKAGYGLELSEDLQKIYK
jgi:hypothetical protein